MLIYNILIIKIFLKIVYIFTKFNINNIITKTNK